MSGSSESRRLAVVLVGAGLMGGYHGETLAHRLPNARLAVVVDPFEAGARKLIDRIGRSDIAYERDLDRALASPDIDAVVIATPGHLHADQIVAAAQAGKHVFTEKPLCHSLDDAERALAAVAQAGVKFQIGFQRRFDPGFQRAGAAVASGALGAIQLLRSITRDPERKDLDHVRRWAIFFDTLIHDFDVIRWLSGSEAVEVQAMGDALVRSDLKAQGLIDTAVVAVRFANGALATADSSFSAAYGYDVRAEVFGSEGMMSIGDGRADTAWLWNRAGVARPQANWFIDMFGHAYTAELAHFVDCIHADRTPIVGADAALGSLRIARAAIESMETGRPAFVK